MGTPGSKFQRSKKKGSVGGMPNSSGWPSGYEASHRVPFGLSQNAFYANISQATGSYTANGKTYVPWDIDGALDNGQPLPRSATPGVTSFFEDPADAARHNGSHPRINAYAEQLFTNWNIELQAKINLNPALANQYRLEFADRARNLSNTIALLSVDGFAGNSADGKAFRLVYNASDPRAAELWSDWGSLNASQKQTRIQSNIDNLIGQWLEPNGSIKPQKQMLMKVMTDLTKGELGLVKAGMAEIAEKAIDVAARKGVNLATQNAGDLLRLYPDEFRNLDPKLVGALTAVAENKGLLSDIARVTMKGGAILVTIGGAVVDKAFAAADVVEYGMLTYRVINGQAVFDLDFEKPRYDVWSDLGNMITTGQLNDKRVYTIPLPANTDNTIATGDKAQIQALADAFFKNNVDLPYYLKPVLVANGSVWGYQLDNINIPGLQNVGVFFDAPPGTPPAGGSSPQPRRPSLVVEDMAQWPESHAGGGSSSSNSGGMVIHDLKNNKSYTLPEGPAAAILRNAFQSNPSVSEATRNSILAGIASVAGPEGVTVTDNEGRAIPIEDLLSGATDLQPDKDGAVAQPENPGDTVVPPPSVLSALWEYLTRAPDGPVARNIGLAFGTALGQFISDGDPFGEIVSGSLLGAVALELGDQLDRPPPSGPSRLLVHHRL